MKQGCKDKLSTSLSLSLSQFWNQSPELTWWFPVKWVTQKRETEQWLLVTKPLRGPLSDSTNNLMLESLIETDSLAPWKNGSRQTSIHTPCWLLSHLRNFLPYLTGRCCCLQLRRNTSLWGQRCSQTQHSFECVQYFFTSLYLLTPRD